MSDQTLRQMLVRLAADQPAGSDFQRKLARVLYAAADFPPESIDDVKPVEEHDSDEGYMPENFNQQEFHELGEKQERGTLNDGKADDDPMKMASMEHALFTDLVKLAHTDEEARGPVLAMLREAGLVTAKGKVPEAFKKQWKDKDKDNDGKENEPKPDFLDKIKDKKKDKKASRQKLAGADRQLFTDLVKLANDDETIRGPILAMLKGEGLV